MPKGTEISEAIATMTSVPTMALPKPPPGSKPGGRELGEELEAEPRRRRG